jgi:Tfp pilus assembly protein FimT
VVLMGAMLAIGLPFFRDTTRKSDVRGSLDVIAALHNMTKQTAVQRGRVARLVMDPSNGTMVVVATNLGGTAVDTVGSVQSLASRFGTRFTTSPSRDTLTFTPRGLGVEAGNTLIIVQKGSFYDTITVSSAGRLTR